MFEMIKTTVVVKMIRCKKHILLILYVPVTVEILQLQRIKCAGRNIENPTDGKISRTRTILRVGISLDVNYSY